MPKFVAKPTVVEAFEIVGVALRPDADGSLSVRLSDGRFKAATNGMTARMRPRAGDYWVVQPDGYVYLNPKDVFETKYRPETEFGPDAYNKILADRAVKVTGETSDGYHTFNELYEHRIELFLALCRMFRRLEREQYVHSDDSMIWKSLKHSDGSSIDGWFILGLRYKEGTQITYHLPMARWDDAPFTERGRAPEWDGHSSHDVLERLKRF